MVDNSCSLIDNFGGLTTKEIIVGLVSRDLYHMCVVREIRLAGGTG